MLYKLRTKRTAKNGLLWNSLFSAITNDLWIDFLRNNINQMGNVIRKSHALIAVNKSTNSNKSGDLS